MSLEQAILNAVRALPAEKQQEVLSHATRLRDQTTDGQPLRSVKALELISAFRFRLKNRSESTRDVEELRVGKHLMSAVAVDTHTIVWYLANDRRLSVKATNTLDSATAAGRVIHLPSICLIERTYLAEKARLPSIARDRLVKALDDASAACRLAPLDRMVADALEFVDHNELPDLPDRIMAATALALQVPLIRRHGTIRASKVQTIW